MATVAEVTLDADRLGIRGLNAALHAVPAGAHVRVLNPRGRHNLAVGLRERIAVDFAGPCGHYLGGLGACAEITVWGPVGRGVGENLMSGGIRVRGDAGGGAAAAARGGTIVVAGDCGSVAGIGLAGGTLAIAGNAGPYCGRAARSGVILVCGDADVGLGDALGDAVIYVGGRIAGLGDGALAAEPDENDLTAAKLIAATCGFDHVDPENLTKVTSVRYRPRLLSGRRAAGRPPVPGRLSAASA
nr:MAG: glutamate synthase [Actinomycetota bacterium]